MAHTIRFVRPDQTAPYFETMRALYRQYYSLDPADFRPRLLSHECCALFFSGDTLVGFTFVKIERGVKVGGKGCVLLGFGTTVLALEHRSQNFMQRTVTRLILREKLRNPLARVYLWTGAASCRPYLIFARHLATAFPKRQDAGWGLAPELVEYVGSTYFSRNGWHYRPELGVAVLNRDNLVTDPSVRLTANDLLDPDIAFFHERSERVRQALGNDQASVALITVAPADLGNFVHWLGVSARRTFTRAARHLRAAAPTQSARLPIEVARQRAQSTSSRITCLLP